MKNILCVFFFILFSHNLLAQEAQETTENLDSLPLDELAALADAYSEVKKSYVKNLSDQEILDGAIQGMLKNLDPHSQYLTASNYANLKKNSSGEYAGIGIKADHQKEGIIVRHIFKNSPADNSALRVGDTIIAIDHKTTLGLSVSEGGALMQGEVGTPILLTIISPSNDKPQDLSLIRSRIEVSSVSAELLADNIAYIRLAEFQSLSERHISQSIFKLESSNKAPLNALILDLRNNPGGLLDSAIAISDLFLNTGAIVSTKGRLDESNEEYGSTHGDILRGKPIVVLINKKSASASEIVAGALQDHKRGYIIGQRSYGKGSVQTTLPIHGGGAIKLTTALYYTPNDRSIHEIGIQPDLEVASLPVTTKTASEVSVSEDKQLIAAIEYLTSLSKK